MEQDTSENLPTYGPMLAVIRRRRWYLWGTDSCLHASISKNATIDSIVQSDWYFTINMGHLAMCCRNADSHCKMSKMRQQLSHA